MSIARKIEVEGVFNWFAHGVGRSSAISKSNRRNRIAIRKKRIENGRRAEPSGSKPHSYGESFSISWFVFGSQNAINIRTVISAVVVNIITIVMYFSLGLS